MEAFIDAKGLVESLLFVSDEVLSVPRLAEITELSQTEVRQALAALDSDYEREQRGFVLREVAGGWRLFSHPAYAEYIERLVLSWDSRRLSQAALEVLAIVAYRQPVTRAQINAVRGVNSEAALSSLVDKGIIREVGRDKSPGQPILYGTSELFLERFGLRSLEDLPPLEEFAPDDESARQIQDGLMGSLARMAALDIGDQAAAGEGEADSEGEPEAAIESEDRQAGIEPDPEDIETVD